MTYLFISLMMACGPKTVSVDGGGNTVRLPDWVMNPPTNKNEICAVGITKMKGNINADMTVGRERARGELSAQLLTHTNRLVKDYQESGETGGETFNEELTTIISKNVTVNALAGSQQTKSENLDGNLYSMVCLDTEKFATAFDEVKQLSEKARVQLRKRAEKGFQDADKEFDKYK